MVTPRVSLSIKYILSELEEIEREDNFRLKRFKELKTKKQKQKDSNDDDEKNLVINEIQCLGECQRESVQDSLKYCVKREEESNKRASVKSMAKEVEVEKVDTNEKNHKKVTIEKSSSKKEFTVTKPSTENLETIGITNYEEEDKIGQEEICYCPLISSSMEHRKTLSEDKIIDQVPNDNSYKYLQGAMFHSAEKNTSPRENEEILLCDCKRSSTWNELKTLLEEVILDRICDKCKKKIKKSSEVLTYSGQSLSKSSKELSKLSVHDSIFSIKSEVVENLGHYERKYKEIIKVSRLQNEDGTIIQKKKVVTVKTDTRNPMKAKPTDSHNNISNNLISKCSCFESSSKSSESIKQYKCGEQERECNTNNENYNNQKQEKNEACYCPTNTKSEPVCSNERWNESRLRPCMSAGGIKELTKLDAVTCNCPGDITVNLTFQNKSGEKLQNINISQLPLVSSFNVNFCNVPKNILKVPRHSNTLFNDLNQASKEILGKDSCKTLSVKNVAWTCTCDLAKTLSKTVDETTQAFNQVGAEVDAMVKNASTDVMDMADKFKNVMVTISKRQDNKKHVNSCHCKLPDCSYIFSKVKKVSQEQPINAENYFKTIDTNTLFKECCTRTHIYAYMFSSFKRIKIDNMVKNACSNTPEFPYLFSKISKEQCKDSCTPNNLKSAEIDAMFNNACHHSFNCSYIFSHLKNIKIDAMFKASCKTKVEFPYILSNVIQVTNIQPSMTSNSKTVEIGNMFKNSCKPLFDFPYIFSNLNSIKIDRMIKDACSHIPKFPYVFSRVENESPNVLSLENDRSNKTKIDEMFKNSCIQPCRFSYIFSRSNNSDTDATTLYENKSFQSNKILKEMACKNAKTCTDSFDYIFSKASKSSTASTDAVNHKNELTGAFSKLLQNESLLPETQLKFTDINKLIEDSCNSNKNCKFKYISKQVLTKNEKNQSTSFCVMFRQMSDSNSSLNTFNCVDVDEMFKQVCKCKSEITYLINKSEHQKCNHFQKRASDSKLENNRQKLFKDSCNCTDNPKCTNKQTLKNTKCRNAKENNFDYIFSKVSKLHSSSHPINCVDIDTMFNNSCLQKNELSYVPNELEDKGYFGLPRYISTFRLQEIEKLSKDVEKRDFDREKCVEPKKYDSNRPSNPIDCFKVNIMFKDACTRKNEFTYVLTKLEEKNSILLARRTSNLRLQEIGKTFEDSSKRRASKKCTLCEHVKCTDTKKYKTVFPYIFSKVSDSVQIKKPFIYDVINTCIHKNAYEYINEGEDNKSTLNSKSATYLRLQKIDKLIKDSCVVCVNPKLNYIFKKVCKPKTKESRKCVCITNKNKVIEQQSYRNCTSLTNYNNINLPCNHSCSRRFLVQIPNSSDVSGCFGIEVMWRPGCVRHDNVESKISTATKCQHSSTSCTANNKTITNKAKGCCPNIIPIKATYNKDDFSQHSPIDFKNSDMLKENDNISLLRRMLESVKNVYVPFIKPAKSEVIKELSHTKADNVISLISNSTTSTYSWKSCVMKTCQAEIENVEKNISYSGFSFGSSLDIASYKSEAVGSSTSTVGNYDIDPKNICFKDNNTATGKRILFDVEMRSCSSMYTTDSIISIKRNRNHSFKAVPRALSKVSDKCSCSSDARTKYIPKSCEVRHKSPNPSCTRRPQSNKSAKGACSFTSECASKHASETKAECCCEQNTKNEYNSRECFRPSESYIAKKKIQTAQKSRSLDENRCCCSKK